METSCLSLVSWITDMNRKTVDNPVCGVFRHKYCCQGQENRQAGKEQPLSHLLTRFSSSFLLITTVVLTTQNTMGHIPKTCSGHR